MSKKIDLKDFREQTARWWAEGKIPPYSSQDALYALRLQKERLTKFGVTLSEKSEFRKGVDILDDSSGVPVADFSKGKYKRTAAYQHIIRSVEFIKDGLHIGGFNGNQVMHVNLLDLRSGEAPDPDRLYICPNCGAVSSVSDLANNGCPHCGSQFDAVNLYPVVTSCFYTKDFAETEEQSDSRFKKIMKICGIIGALAPAPLFLLCLVYFVGSVIEGSYDGPNFFFMIMAFAALSAFGAAMGFYAGYLVYFFSNAGKAAKQLAQSVKYLNSLSSKSKSESFMKNYDPEFRFEMLEESAQALLKTLVFSDDYTNLTQYIGQDKRAMFTNVVDLEYVGTGVERCTLDRGFTVLDTVVFARDSEFVNGQVIQSNHKYNLRLVRRATALSSAEFTLHNIKCGNCGGAFDAVHTNTCPYCGSRYDVAGFDWQAAFISRS